MRETLNLVFHKKRKRNEGMLGPSRVAPNVVFEPNPLWPLSFDAFWYPDSKNIKIFAKDLRSLAIRSLID